MWLPTLTEMTYLRTEDPYYEGFGWDRLVVPVDCTQVQERMDILNDRFYERYAMRMINSETFERWQMRLQNRFDEIVDKYNRAYALYTDNNEEMLTDIRTGLRRTIDRIGQASGADSLTTQNVNRRIDTPDSAVNADENYADAYSKSNGANTTSYGRRDTANIVDEQQATGILLENVNRTIDGWKDIDTMFVAEFENLFLNVFWY